MIRDQLRVHAKDIANGGFELPFRVVDPATRGSIPGSPHSSVPARQRRVPSAGRKVRGQKTSQQVIEMRRGAGAFRDRVGAIRIRHEVERLAELNQTVYQELRTLVVHVIVPGAVHDEEIAFEAFRKVDG